MYVTIQIPLYEYDNFVKAIDPSSRAAEIVKNACLQRDSIAGGLQPFMEITCTEEELLMLLELGEAYCPEVVPFVVRSRREAW
jgi:hypothetical protein